MTQLTFPRLGVTSCHIRWTLWFFLAPMLLWLFLLIVLPHLDLLYMSLQVEDDSGGMAWGLANYGKFFEEPIYWNTFVRTAGYSILVTFITFVVALPVAFYITKVVRPSLTGFLMTLLLPFWVSELVRVYGWMILLPESGIINHFLIRFGLLDHPVEMLYNDATMVIPLLSTLVGTCAAFLFEQAEFRFKSALYYLMLAPLIIPGVILGISILLGATSAGLAIENLTGIDIPLLRPSFWLVVAGQFAFIKTFVTLVVSARLKKFDPALEEAALNLGATRIEVIRFMFPISLCAHRRI